MKSLINKYISLAKESLIQREDTSTNRISLLKSWKDRLLEKVEYIESHQIFEDLIFRTIEVYRDNFFKDNYRDIRGGHIEDITAEDRLLENVEYIESHQIVTDMISGTIELYREIRGGHVEDVTADWEILVKTFFRRSGFYIKLSKDEPIDIDLVCHQYDEAFTAKEVPVRYLAPLEFVNFYDVDRLNFPSFSIRRFSPQELSEVINNTVNEVFYPDAIWDFDKLSMFWFIDVVIPKVNTNKLLQTNDYFAYFGNYRHESDNLDPIKDVLKILSLFDWNSIHNDGNCQGFNVPFVSQVDEYFLAYPDSFPIGKKLEMANSYEDFDDDNMHYYHHKIIGREPLILCQLDEKNVNRFIEFVSVVDNQFSDICKKWPFYNNALEFILKAFFHDDFYRPIDQLLWNIVAIEALLGDKGEGLTNRLAARLSRILAKSDDVRDYIKKEFKIIYNLRCNLIHGSSWDEKLDRKYLFLSRNLARKASMKFFYLFAYISTSGQFNPKKHSRKEILSFIDSDLIFDENGLENILR